MVPLSEIIERCRTRFEQESTARWADADFTDAINEALDELSEATAFHESYVTLPQRTNRTWYDLRGWLPENAVGITSVWNTVSSTWLKPIKPEDLKYPQWERTPGTPQEYFLRGIYWLGIHPKNNADSGYLRVHFCGLAPHFTMSQHVLAELPDDFIPAIEDYVLYELHSQDGEAEKALMYWQSYRTREDMLGGFVRNRITRARTLRLGG